ncbi:MAG: NUDIX hydrolase [Candidatus Micrarchaeota archaeon]
MSRVRTLREKPELPKALACGMLEDGGRVLFLIQKDRQGVERLELPSVLVYPGQDPAALLKQAFEEQAGIDAQIGDIVNESSHNAGSRKKRRFILCLVFKAHAKSGRARPSPQFSGVKWLSLEKAKEAKLGRKAEWLRKR